MRKSPLLRKAFFAVALVFAATMGITAVASAWRIHNNLTAQYASKGTAIANGIAGSSVDLLLFRDVSTIQALIDQFLNIEGVAYVFVVAPDGEVLAHTFAPAVPEEVKAVEGHELDTRTQIIRVEGQGEFLDISTPILAGKVGHVHVGMDRRLIQAAIWSDCAHQIGILFLIFLFSLAATFWLMNHIVQPLTHLTRHANQLAAGHFPLGTNGEAGAEMQAITTRADEVGQLAQAFQHMIQEVSHREAELRQAHDELEARVQERTAELVQVNTRLQEEMTERTRVDEALRTSQTRLHLALQSSSFGTWEWKIEGNTITWDDYLHPLFGLEPGAFKGRYEDFLAVLHPDDRERVSKAVAGAVYEGAEYDVEFRVIWPDNSVHVLGARGSVYRDEQDNPLLMSGVCWDLTQRKRAEEERNRMAAILEATTDFVGMARPDGPVMFINRAGRMLVGLDEETPVSQTVVQDYHPPWALDVVMHEGIPTAMREGFWSGESALCRRDGTEVPVSQVVLAHKNGHGEVEFLSTIMRDMTERKQAEDDLRSTARELARSNAELEQFAYIASHDLQEPLRKVQAFGDMLVSQYQDVLGEEGQDYLRRMQNASQRMQALINDLLTFSRVTTKGKPFQEVDLADVARQVNSDLEARIRETGGRVEVGELPVLDADATQMGQLLQNLIGNALKFHRKDVTPVVKVEGREVSTGPLSMAVCEITIEDNGIGFEEKYRDRIFALFHRLHGRREYEGTGMGLAICRKIVERHGGTITAQSTPGQGARFIVTLPLRQSKGASHE
jgi:PAS domain S-box-containing protein